MNAPERLYRFILRAYPRRFRDEVASELLDTFTRFEKGMGNGRRRFVLRELADLLLNLPAEWWTTWWGGRRGARGCDRKSQVPFQHLYADVRIGLRGLRKRPGFTVATTVVLGIGIGATTSIFTVVNAVLLRPLPYPESERLVTVWQTNPRWSESPNPILRSMAYELSLSWATYQDWLESNTSFDALGVYMSPRTMAITGGGESDILDAVPSSSGLFATLGVPPLLGRTLVPADDVMGATPVAVLSHGLWVSRYGADPSIVGTTVILDEVGHTVVGVMPPSFYFPTASSQLWTSLEDRRKAPRSGAGEHFWAIGRVRSGKTLHQAQVEMEALAQRMRESDPGYVYGVRLIDRREEVVGDVKAVLGLLVAAVAAVLLITCANIANLLLMRSSERQQELGIRSALGADRRRILAQLLTESMLLALLGGAVGLALVGLGLRSLVGWLPPELPRASEIRLDRGVLLICTLATLGTSLLMGILPALRGARWGALVAFPASGDRTTRGPLTMRVQAWIVVAEVALSFALVVGAGLMVKSMAKISEVELGFEAHNLVTLRFDFFGRRYGSEEQRRVFSEEIQERLGALPGVEGVAGAAWVPFVRDPWGGLLYLVDASGPARVNVTWNRVGESYFDVLEIPIVSGRTFGPDDLAGTPHTAIISEALARAYWPGEDPLGKLIGEEEDRNLSIVGVAADIRHPGYGSDLTTEPRSMVYLPDREDRVTALRVTGLPASIIRAALAVVQELDPNLPVSAQIVSQEVRRSMAGPRFRTWVISLFAGLAVLLASVGVYGVVSYAVTQRRREIGIRIALGASSRIILETVVRRGILLTAVGLSAGLGVVLVAAHTAPAFGSLLYDVSPADPGSMMAVAFLMLAVGASATLVSALRATRVDPGRTLREE